MTPFILFFGCSSYTVASSGFFIPTADYVSGQYSVKDYAGAVKITNVKVDPYNIHLIFSNCLTATFRSFYTFKQGENNCILLYRGYGWNKKYKITIHEICEDDFGQLMYIVFSTSTTVKDCEKNILSMDINRLHVQSSLVPGCKKP